MRVDAIASYLRGSLSARGCVGRCETLLTSSIANSDGSSPAEKSLCTPACLPRRKAAIVAHPLLGSAYIIRERRSCSCRPRVGKAYLSVALYLSSVIIPLPSVIMVNGPCHSKISILPADDTTPKSPPKDLYPHSLPRYPQWKQISEHQSSTAQLI